MASTKHEKIGKEIAFTFRNGSKGEGEIWQADIIVSKFGATIVYSVSYRIHGEEATVRVDEEFNEID